jgi:hypothetical protein
MNPPPGQYIGHLCPTSTLVDLTVAATVRLRGRRAQIPRHAVDLKPGLLHAILKQLGITPEDLES